jgi:hypothetical protein
MVDGFNTYYDRNALIENVADALREAEPQVLSRIAKICLPRIKKIGHGPNQSFYTWEEK